MGSRTPVAFWADKVEAKLAGRMARSMAAIDAVLGRPAGRRVDTKVALREFFEEPAAYDGEGRERLANYVKATYGANAARHLMPYIAPELASQAGIADEPVGEEMGDGSGFVF